MQADDIINYRDVANNIIEIDNGDNNNNNDNRTVAADIPGGASSHFQALAGH